MIVLLGKEEKRKEEKRKRRVRLDPVFDPLSDRTQAPL